ncbi:DUF262 domain-containing protein [Pelagerythrobacter aerophilus]
MPVTERSDQEKLADALFPERKLRDDEATGILDVPLDQRRLHTETYDFTVGTIYSLLTEGRIRVPEFQRRYVWNRAQASRLIESLIIQCPIPVIYLDQEDDGSLYVIDGNQRLMSIKLFLSDSFKLRGLTAFPDLNGYNFSGLDPRFQTHIENRTVRCITILKETHPHIKFDVFERLNTGSVQLNAQELRHGLYHGRLMELLDRMGEFEPWQRLSGIRGDKRMRGAELILRFLALYFDLDNYEKPLSSFLNSFSKKNRNAGREEEFLKEFERAVQLVDRVFSENSFRMVSEEGTFEQNFNAAVFDAQMVGLALSPLNPEDLTQTQVRALLKSYLNLSQEKEFRRAITASTSDEPLVRRRINAVRRLASSAI